ncbi:MAG: hypothetical protein KatS3mg110_0007 [Pirellulaceae bacterium]|nr:MAG: hypothetical protein KatS3mg110_0007 [Pirellulaceae bacterium]
MPGTTLFAVTVVPGTTFSGCRSAWHLVFRRRTVLPGTIFGPRTVVPGTIVSRWLGYRVAQHELQTPYPVSSRNPPLGTPARQYLPPRTSLPRPVAKILGRHRGTETFLPKPYLPRLHFLFRDFSPESSLPEPGPRRLSPGSFPVNPFPRNVPPEVYIVGTIILSHHNSLHICNIPPRLLLRPDKPLRPTVRDISVRNSPTTSYRPTSQPLARAYFVDTTKGVCDVSRYAYSCVLPSNNDRKFLYPNPVGVDTRWMQIQRGVGFVVPVSFGTCNNLCTNQETKSFGHPRRKKKGP